MWPITDSEVVSGGKAENSVLFHTCHLLLCISASSLGFVFLFSFANFPAYIPTTEVERQNTWVLARSAPQETALLHGSGWWQALSVPSGWNFWLTDWLPLDSGVCGEQVIRLWGAGLPRRGRAPAALPGLCSDTATWGSKWVEGLR